MVASVVLDKSNSYVNILKCTCEAESLNFFDWQNLMWVYIL